jgi:penicillin-binding protein 1C
MNEVMRPVKKAYGACFRVRSVSLENRNKLWFSRWMAVGFTPKYCIVVGWVIQQERAADLTGINTAAPIMFDIFRICNSNGLLAAVRFYVFACLPQSGLKQGICHEVDTMLVSFTHRWQLFVLIIILFI